MSKRVYMGSDEWYEANKHLCHEWDTENPDGGFYVECMHCGERANHSNGRNYCPSRRANNDYDEEDGDGPFNTSEVE